MGYGILGILGIGQGSTLLGGSIFRQAGFDIRFVSFLIVWAHVHIISSIAR